SAKTVLPSRPLSTETTYPQGLGDEVLRLGVGDHDCGCRLLGYQVEFLGDRDADAVDLEQLRDLHLVVEIGAGGIAPRVARPSILLAEQPRQRRAVLVGEAPLLANAAVPIL